jgi:hypothetical protein
MIARHHAPALVTALLVAIAPSRLAGQAGATAALERDVRAPLQPGATARYACTDVRPCTKNSPLLGSGLLGPVRLETVR